MHIEFLLEEPSAEAALNILLPKLLPPDATWSCYPHRGKTDLFQRLPGRLKTYARQFPHQPDLRVVILMDADTDCRRRKAELEKVVADVGLLTKTTAVGQPFRIITRLAVQELEAWFLGDREAIQTAYPRVRPQHFSGLPHDPDAISDTWETLWRVLQEGKYYLAGKAKVEWAETISPHLDPERNQSASFQYFRQGLGHL
ncbi:protein of unknown function [Hymenobacter gelipurpurascens]|uniref:DUF4276 family protein n=1 Tax=Hymenobacter gelipurpurascens TaxID=89968 RepID=A0A212UCX7_9BACT|nr:DUF4276 family protein [Hymenobacter gelipurpurascens]SNC75951.1 protein of unknown function [Hymenobacter gelipurpurascens]